MAAKHCCVPMCTNYLKKNPQLSFHHFPKDSILCKRWIQVIRRDVGAHFKITDATYVCSQHFVSNDFRWTPNRRCLLPDAIPSVFAWSKTSAPRKPPAKRRFLVIDL
ncbi:THAP domain-containing protein 1 B-like [Exaiptasia diaphana]|uniref:THAP-type domain-containing protein n=1 Tax=Exaiptasia diaphana TaxID=2652724 RepID=A0A913Y8Y5_EXADI|nr:THAP domain-containing protein 1 B-like [Exaiptasia diaphana]